jgi:hypothetical protein
MASGENPAMPTKSATPFPTAMGLDWVPAWIKAWEIAWAAPQVVTYRMMRMMWGGWPPSARDRREYSRMGQEKADAMTQSLMAGAMAWPMAGAAVFEKMLAPVHTRVTANNRRLSRR